MNVQLLEYARIELTRALADTSGGTKGQLQAFSENPPADKNRNPRRPVHVVEVDDGRGGMRRVKAENSAVFVLETRSRRRPLPPMKDSEFESAPWRRAVNELPEHEQAWLRYCYGFDLTFNYQTLICEAKGQALSITLDGKKGEKLGDVLRRALHVAFPDFTLEIDISDKLILAEDGVGVYSRLGQLAATIRSQSISMINSDSYAGVQMVMQNKIIRIFDNTVAGDAGGILILPQELTGQPTWIGPVSVSFKCPMRADLRCGDTVELPANIISGPSSLLSINNDRSYAVQRNTVNFSGKFLITSVRHVGQYLNPDNSNSWVTIYEAVALAK